MNLLICVAGMPYAIPTLSFGGKIARLLPSSVTLLTVIDREEQRPSAQDLLTEAARKLESKGQPVDTVIRLGTPSRQIMREARKRPYDLIILGDRQNRRGRLFLSATVQKVVKKASLPVLVVKDDRPAIDKILICTSGRDLSEPVISMGATLAQAAHAKTTLLHVTPPLPSMYTGLAGMEEELAELLQTETPLAQHLRRGAAFLARYGISARIVLRHGVAAQQILREADKGDYDLIVMGSWIRPGLIRGLFTGDVVREVVDNAVHPVLVVSHEQRAGTIPQPIAQPSATNAFDGHPG